MLVPSWTSPLPALTVYKVVPLLKNMASATEYRDTMQVACNKIPLCRFQTTLAVQPSFIANSLDSSIYMSPGSYYTVRLTAQLPPNMTLLLTFDVQMVIITRACMTVSEFRMVTTGANIGCLERRAASLVNILKSTQNTSQNDVACLDIGPVTISGEKTG